MRKATHNNELIVYLHYMKYFIALFATIVLLPLHIYAQTLAPDIALEVSPSNPQPGKSVTITARSYELDTAQTFFSWTYNGSIIAEGTGKTSVQVVAPNAGVSGTITVRATGVGIQETTASTTLRPASIDLLWEAVDAYTPPFYKGKALFPVGGIVRAVAIPSTAAPKQLSYTWKRNTFTQEASSGYEKTSFIFRNDPLQTQENIEVSVVSGGFSGASRIKLQPYAPVALWYEVIDGMVQVAKGYNEQLSTKKSGIVLRIEPYYFSVPNTIEKDLGFSLTVNKEEIGQETQREFAFSHPGQSQKNVFSFGITTTAYSLQHLEKLFTLIFE